MAERKQTLEESKRKMLLAAGRKLVQPLKHVEFICPMCGGIATVNKTEERVRAECHACGRYAKERL